MSRIYVLSNSIVGFTGPKTVAEISAAASKVLKIQRIKISQSTSEADDSTRLTWGTYTATGTGTTVTANVKPVDKGDSAYSGVAKDDHSVDITTGEAIIGREGISLLAGFEKIFLPGARPVVTGSEFFAINLLIGISSVTLDYEITFEEIG